MSPLVLFWMLRPSVRPWVSGPGILMIAYASTLHLTWAVMLLFSRHPMGATPLAVLDTMTFRQTPMSVLVLLLASGLALSGLRQAGTGGWLWLLPQQAVLIFSAWGGLVAWWVGHYADGTQIESQHILADQLAYMLMALFYAASIIVTRTIAVTAPIVDRRQRHHLSDDPFDRR